jgi:hypothetical protein
VIEASKLVSVEVESRSQTPSQRLASRLLSACIDVARILCTHYIDDHLPYAPIELCSYWGCGQVFHTRNLIPNYIIINRLVLV